MKKITAKFILILKFFLQENFFFINLKAKKTFQLNLSVSFQI